MADDSRNQINAAIEKAFGIPYAYVNADRTRTCPVCGQIIPETYADDGEIDTNNYGLHYEAKHKGDQQ